MLYRRGQQDVSLADLVKIDINNENTNASTKDDGHCGNLSGIFSDHGHEKLWTNQGPDTWIITDFKGTEQTFVGIGIRSANDDPAEDPKTVRVSVPKEEGSDEWVEVMTIKPEFTHERNELKKFVIPETTTKKMRFDFNNTDMSHGQRIMQVGGLAFFGDKNAL